MKKLMCLLCIALVYSACKKNGGTGPSTGLPPFNVTGTWTVYSSSDSTFDHNSGQFLSVAQYPCISNNMLYIRAGGIAVSKFIGTSPCYISQAGVNGATVTETFGQPGQDSTVETWSLSGNKIHLHFLGGGGININDYGTLSNNGSTLQMSLTDTLDLTPNGGGKYLQSGVLVKQ